MDNAQAVQDFNVSATKDAEPQQAGPPFTIVMTNVDPGETWITLPESGSLLVYYEHSRALAQGFYIWHQTGSRTPLRPGENTIPVKSGDQLIYTLANPGGDVLKFGYKYI